MTTLSPHQPGPAGQPGRRVTPKAPPVYGLAAEFDSPAAIMHAAVAVRDAGYRWWDCHTPFPVHGLDKAMGMRSTILPWLVLGGGATGGLTGLALQWFTNATGFDFWLLVPVRGYAFWVSGKPPFSFPAFVPVIFELTILLAALTAVFGMILLNGLPRWYHPVFKSRRFLRASDDRFFVVIEACDPKYSPARTRQLLDSLHPMSIEELEA